MFVSCSLSSEDTIELPYKSDFSTIEGWSLGNHVIFDNQNKAFKLSRSGSTWMSSDYLISDFKLPVYSNQTYTISLDIKTDVWAPPILEISAAFYGDSGFISNSLGTMIANSKTNIWEESTVNIDIPNNQEIKFLKIRIIDMPKKGKDGNIWVREVSCTKGFRTTKKSPQKRDFNGSVTSVDKTGNMKIFKNGKFEPFFPIGIYTDNKREDWSIYKKQGFNIAMWADGADSIKKAKKAGLYSAMELVQYILPVDPNWIPQEPSRKMVHLKTTLQKIKDEKLTNDMLFYYIDNEFYHLKKEYTDIVDAVLAQDMTKEVNGTRMHPLYMLSGTYGLARVYNKRVDFTGTYVAVDTTETDRTNAFVTLNKTQNQTQPAVMAQINRGVGLNFRPILFGAIAKGAKGVAFWKDDQNASDIALKPWWSDLPKIAKEIELMMPLIQADTNNSWSVTRDTNITIPTDTNSTKIQISTSDKIIYKTKTLDNKGYMIVANPTRAVHNLAFKIKNLPYKVKSINDYFTKKSISVVDKEAFTITLQPHGTAVLEFVK